MVWRRKELFLWEEVRVAICNLFYLPGKLPGGAISFGVEIQAGCILASCCFVLFSWLLPVTVKAQRSYDVYTSNEGNDHFPGTSAQFPKKTIAGTIQTLKQLAGSNKVARLALKSGDRFEESLVTSYPIEIGTYLENPSKPLRAILDGSTTINDGWGKAPGFTNAYLQQVAYNGFTGAGINTIGQYSFIYVTEIDKALEKTAPFSARKILSFVASRNDVDNTAGSFYIPQTNEQPMPVLVHTSDGRSPNNHPLYRYEVTVRDWAVNSTNQANNRFENLWVTGFGAGNGMLPGGDNSFYKNIVFGPGAGIHHLVTRSGRIDHSLFLPGPRNTGEFAVVFYDVQGLGRHCAITNSIFLDIPSPVYAHTSGGKNYGAVELDHVAAFADTVKPAGFMYTFNNDSVLMNYVYAEGFTTGYNYGSAPYASIKNSCFKDVGVGIGFGAANPIRSVVDNVFIKTRGASFTHGFTLLGNTNLRLTNSVVHLANENHVPGGPRAGFFIEGCGGGGNRVDVQGNIFICDIDPDKSVIGAIVNTDGGPGSSSDQWNKNVYILLSGKSIVWSVTNTATNYGKRDIETFKEWQRQSGQDQESLYFDLRSDPRGLKAIFVDPANGNYELANTPEGKQIAALRSGMTDPVTCFLKRPSYEAAAAIIGTGDGLSVNSCKSPCRQNAVREDIGFQSTLLNTRQVQLKWKVQEQRNIDHYELQRSVAYFPFSRISTFGVKADSLYYYTDIIQPNTDYRYRLVVLPKAGNKCYGDMPVVKTTEAKFFTISPNPSKGKIKVSLAGYVGDVELIVFNTIGQPLITRHFTNFFNPCELDLSGQPAGTYLLKTITPNGSTVQHFSIQ